MRKEFFLETLIEKVWYSKNIFSLLLSPLSLIYISIIYLRYTLYQLGLISITKINVPTIVIGNIVAGGTGKTPLVIWLAKHFKDKGFLPGIVSRGYGGTYLSNIELVKPTSNPLLVGDEPVIIARNTNCPVVVAKKRAKGAKELVEKYNCNIILCDDGMQHYSLARDIEIAVIDGQRRFGNNYCFPAGPLREPKSRIFKADLIVSKYNARTCEHKMDYTYHQLVSLNELSKTIPISDLHGMTVHAIAGINNPDHFFSYLRSHKLELIIHKFPDHYSYTEDDVKFDDNFPVVMTEKDAVKCLNYSSDKHWYIPISAELSKSFVCDLDKLMGKIING
tara:strand:- start:1598 stop:2602 length:1005 start_codon:yes stop_codon:yes gene_type:complete